MKNRLRKRVPILVLSLLQAFLLNASRAETGHQVLNDTIRRQESATVPNSESAKHTNRLIREISPYLLQHAHNPVDWFPWGEEAFQKARDEHKPVFLSIGYSACHWCHVMERESFENDEVAAYLNDCFVSIKVDREERPDLDEIYMNSVQILTGSGGWPMSVFLTPDRKPFYGGTYFPPVDMYGRPSFLNVLKFLAKAWNERHDELVKSADQLAQYIRQSVAGQAGDRASLNASLLSGAAGALQSSFDATYGGFGGAPKFPSSPSIAVLFREYLHTGNRELLRMATTTLDRMAYGGMYDQLGGGFHRYSVDEQWLVPHFEKMLYDNAQLAQVYLEAYQLTQDPVYRRVASEILDYVLRDMTDERGGFYCAEDADSEGEEGKFYLWTYEELRAALGESDAKAFCVYYRVKPEGNFDSHESYHHGQNILHMPHPSAEVALQLGVSDEALHAQIRACRDKLLSIRAKRVRPHLDDKVLSSWNGLMISALAQGYQVLGDVRYRAAAEKAAAFILKDMTRNGELVRAYRRGESRGPAFLDDYAFLAAGLIDLYEATFDLRWLTAADALAQGMLKKFWDEGAGGLFMTEAGQGDVLARSKPMHDGAEPSGNSVAALVLPRLAKLLDRRDYLEKATYVLEMNQSNLEKSPQAFLKMLCAVDFLLDSPKEIALVGKAEGSDMAELLKAVHSHFIPNKVVAGLDPAGPDRERVEAAVPLLGYKTMVDGKATAYVCKDFACRAPVTGADALLTALGVTSEGKQ